MKKAKAVNKSRKRNILRLLGLMMDRNVSELIDAWMRRNKWQKSFARFHFAMFS